MISSSLIWFQLVLSNTLNRHFSQETRDNISSNEILREWSDLLEHPVNEQELTTLLLALCPHLAPQILDPLFSINEQTSRPYTEFGGWKGTSHGGFLPTGETAAFLLCGNDISPKREVMKLFGKKHWFHTEHILSLEGQGEHETFIRGRLIVSEEFLCKILFGEEEKHDLSMNFPAKLMTTPLKWKDLILSYQAARDLEEINIWLSSHNTIMDEWGLGRILKPGYRALFHGPPGTGKTLAATLLGQRNGLDVYRVDLSLIVSKYIGETEKNLSRIFDLAERRNWLLFFDEADALFGKRTGTQTSNDRHANQEVAYLLQRIEDFPGTVILASNLKSNMDDAFSRRFQSCIYFPMPNTQERTRLWRNMLPADWLGDDGQAFIKQASEMELSGGSIANVVRRCALGLISSGESRLNPEMLEEALRKELSKEGKL